MKISKEGLQVIPTAAICCVVLAAGLMILTCWAFGAGWLAAYPGAFRWIGLFWVVAALIGFGLVVWFFRVPSRPVLTDDDVVFSPCDGRVVIVEETTEGEVTGERRIQVSVFMSIRDVHQNWFPVGGRIVYSRHHNGHFHVAYHPKSSEKNEHTTVGVETPHGVVVFRQIAGFVARRIVSYARVGSEAEQNTPCGFIKFGSRMDLLLPPGAEVLVSVGDRVTGSQTPVARFSK